MSTAVSRVLTGGGHVVVQTTKAGVFASEKAPGEPKVAFLQAGGLLM